MDDAPKTIVLEILREARALIAEPEHWTTNVLFRDAEGSVMFRPRQGEPGWNRGIRPRPYAFCSLGALQYAAAQGEDKQDAVWPATNMLRFSMDGSVASFNNSHSHAEVLEAWDRAIAKLEAA